MEKRSLYGRDASAVNTTGCSPRHELYKTWNTYSMTSSPLSKNLTQTMNQVSRLLKKKALTSHATMAERTYSPAEMGLHRHNGHLEVLITAISSMKVIISRVRQGTFEMKEQGVRRTSDSLGLFGGCTASKGNSMA